MRLPSEKWPKNRVWTHVRGGPAFALHKDMTFAGARCPSCHSLHIDQTFRTWCATYLRCGDCGNMWTLRHHADGEEPHDKVLHPHRRHTDEGVRA
jgi:Zn ribbon nucleic-acid-binding protein